ncbi:hypothetical protein MAR_028746 [Mya arenaria]|uniref:Uncharacterized protein n=2 Tax=Mya arenaria TaxID=6604 RepID=A0ABY7DGE8_MYAAR|nr:hypothetical protein MAR_028746 [Mya arenaria]
MEQANTTLPSKEAQYSNLGMSMGRKKMSKDRQAVHRRRSVIPTNKVEPSHGEVNDAMQKLGLGDMVIDTDEERDHVMKLIRAMPRPMSVKKDMR